MKLTKKLISIVLTSVFLLSFVSIPASAEVQDVIKTINMDYHARFSSSKFQVGQKYNTVGTGILHINEGNGWDEGLFLKFKIDGTVGYLKSAELDALILSKVWENPKFNVLIKQYSTADAPEHVNTLTTYDSGTEQHTAYSTFLGTFTNITETTAVRYGLPTENQGDGTNWPVSTAVRMQFDLLENEINPVANSDLTLNVNTMNPANTGIMFGENAPFVKLVFDSNKALEDLNAAATADGVEAVLSIGATALGLDNVNLDALSDNCKAVVLDALVGKNFATLDDVKQAYDGAINSLTTSIVKYEETNSLRMLPGNANSYNVINRVYNQKNDWGVDGTWAVNQDDIYTYFNFKNLPDLSNAKNVTLKVLMIAKYDSSLTYKTKVEGYYKGQNTVTPAEKYEFVTDSVYPDNKEEVFNFLGTIPANLNIVQNEASFSAKGVKEERSFNLVENGVSKISDWTAGDLILKMGYGSTASACREIAFLDSHVLPYLEVEMYDADILAGFNNANDDAAKKAWFVENKGAFELEDGRTLKFDAQIDSVFEAIDKTYTSYAQMKADVKAAEKAWYDSVLPVGIKEVQGYTNVNLGKVVFDYYKPEAISEADLKNAQLVFVQVDKATEKTINVWFTALHTNDNKLTITANGIDCYKSMGNHFANDKNSYVKVLLVKDLNSLKPLTMPFGFDMNSHSDVNGYEPFTPVSF